MGLTFLDLFAGIGGFRLGMEAAGHKCVGWVEWDKFARISYEAIHDTEGEWTANDITRVSDDDIRELGRTRGPIHVITGGFPCQAFSIAGKRRGFEDTRGTLFFEIARFANIIRPRYLFLENVKGLLNHAGGDTFETILRTLDEIGYDAEWDVLNSKDFGVPQNRERVFIIGHLRGASTRKVFPIGQQSSGAIEIIGRLGIKGDDYIKRVYSTGGLSPCLPTMQGGSQEPKVLVNVEKGKLKIREDNTSTCLDANYFKGLDNHQARTGVLEVVPILTPDRPEKRQNGRRFKEPGEEMFTLTAQDRHGVMIHQKGRGFNKGGTHDIAPALTSNSYQDNNHLNDGFRIRKLTPRECWRLQGLPDWAFDRASAVNSDSQLYKQAGNSVTVNVIEAIAVLFNKR